MASGKAPTWFTVSICCLLIYLGFIVWAQVQFGSYRYALSYLRGSRLQVQTPLTSVGTHRPGESFQATVTIRNHGSRQVQIIGALTGCPCVAYLGLPATLPPGHSVALPVTARFGESLGEWRQTITYLTDDVHQPSLRADLQGRVVAFAR